MPDKLSCRTKNTAIEISYYKNKLAFLACSETRLSLRSHPIRLSAGCNDLRGREVELNLDFTSLQWPIQGRVDQTAVVLRLGTKYEIKRLVQIKFGGNSGYLRDKTVQLMAAPHYIQRRIQKV